MVIGKHPSMPQSALAVDAASLHPDGRFVANTMVQAPAGIVASNTDSSVSHGSGPGSKHTNVKQHRKKSGERGQDKVARKPRTCKLCRQGKGVGHVWESTCRGRLGRQVCQHFTMTDGVLLELAP